MRILLDCRPLQYVMNAGERARWILSCTRELSERYGVEWLYIMDKRGEDLVKLPGDARIGEPDGPGIRTGGARWITSSSLPGKAGWKLWYDWQLPRLVKKHRPDWVMTTGGVAAAVKTPQICWMPQDVLTKGAKKGLAGLSRKRLAASLRAARAIFCFSADLQLYIQGLLPAKAADTRVIVIPPAAGTAHVPLSQEQREKAKVTYAGGKEYFFVDLAGAGEDDLVYLLRAFSRFKKRQLSNMQLVLAGRAGGDTTAAARAIAERLETYKYRQDLHQYPEGAPSKEGGPSKENDDPAMRGGAYAIVRPFTRAEGGLSIVEAWKSRVPLIETTTDARRLKGEGEAGPVLYAAAGDPAALAEKLMMIYKDEALRSTLVEKGAALAEGLGWEGTAAAIWAALVL